MEVVLNRIGTWSIAVFPVFGFLVGQVIQLALGTKSNRQLESIVVHLITVIMLVFLSAYAIANENTKSPTDKVIFVGVSYLFVLGTVFGIISVLI
jgi:hypothetical protein